MEKINTTGNLTLQDIFIPNNKGRMMLRMAISELMLNTACVTS